MMKKLLLTTLFLGALGIFLFQACKKDKTSSTSTDTDTVSAEDHSTSDELFTDAYNIVDESIREDGSLNKTNSGAILNGCANVTIDTTSSPWKMTIDFGSSCTGNDGRTRSGKILVTLTGRYRNTGTVLTITFDNYYVNGNKVEGTKTVTNMGTNAAGHPYFKIEVKDAKITTSEGYHISWESTRQREWIAGYNTPNNVLDDVYSITGTASGTNRNGVSYEANITNPLKVAIGCRWIESGTISLKPSDKAERIIDYGDGSCDNKATVSINGKTYNISLR